jgi:hypothetical protein
MSVEINYGLCLPVHFFIQMVSAVCVLVYCSIVTCFISSCLVTGFLDLRSLDVCMYVCMYVCM